MKGNAKDNVVRARIDSGLKAQASRVLAACGLEPSDAIRLFLQQVVAHNGIPFAIRGAEAKFSSAQLAALKRQSQDRDHHLAASADVACGNMFLIRPEQARGAKVRWPKARLA